MRRVWVYQGDFGPGKDFCWMSLTRFRQSFTVQQAVGYHTIGRKALVALMKGLDRRVVHAAVGPRSFHLGFAS
jgi:hypothetical protein